MPSSPAARLRLAAIDLDGTLLGPDLTISAENARAVAKLAEHGIAVALASGRHYASMRPYTEQLPAVRWVVSAQGAEVADRDRGLVLLRRFLAPEKVEAALEAAARRHMSHVVYAPDGVYTTGPNDPDVNFYRCLAGVTPVRVTRAEIVAMDVFKVVWLGAARRMTAVIGEGQIVSAVDVVQTHARIVEFIPPHVSKAVGLEALAQHLGLTAANAVVFGDADNDIPMFRWAGLSVAMPHGWPSAIAHATRTGPAASPGSALAVAIDDVLARA